MGAIVKSDEATLRGPDVAGVSNAPATRERTLEAIIGMKIRSLRLAQQLTAAELAVRSGLSGSMLSKIENGAISASLATLQAIAEALNTPIASFFHGAEERRDCSYVPAGQGVKIERRGTKVGHHYELLGHLLAPEFEFEPYLITLSDGAQAYTGFQHQGLEFIYMLTGRVTYRHGDATYPLAPGDSLFFDAGAPHGPERLDETPMTYLSIIVWPRQR
ncbi:XRE family transcriptional regulator [Terrarubrum flagellatum]|uniref:helix-turn-helix domain-containing protein n=1 Tax=Terrirubrum flagellatum TaxID=2895980 RepID=UPI003144EB73